jgi:hypothetical protein
VVLETSVNVDIVVRMKVNSSLKVERSDKFETAVRKAGCGIRVEKVAPSYNSV